MKKKNRFGLKVAAMSLLAAVICSALVVAGYAGSGVYAVHADPLDELLSYNAEEFNVEYDSSPVDVDNYIVGGSVEYQGGKVAQDAGKKGIHIKSVEHGAAASGRSFEIGGVMSGRFDIDFRIPSAITFQAPIGDSTNWWAPGKNEYADVQQVVFTFTDAADETKKFDVVIDAYTHYTMPIASISVRLADGLKRAHQYYDGYYGCDDTTDGDNGDGLIGINTVADNEIGYLTRLDGTGFSNVGGRTKSAAFTEGAFSTKFAFNPEDMVVSAERRYRDGYENYGAGIMKLVPEHRQVVLDLDNPDEVLADNVLTGFETYRVKVTFSCVTADDAVIKDNGADTTADRYAQMYIYSLKGIAMDGLTDTTAPQVDCVLPARIGVGEECRPILRVTDRIDGNINIREIPFDGTFVITGPDGENVENDNGVFVPAAAGDYTLHITAKDAGGNEGAYECTMHVDEEVCPVVAPEISFKEGTPEMTEYDLNDESGKPSVPSGDDVAVDGKGWDVEVTVDIAGPDATGGFGMIGEYTITYTAKSESGLNAEVKRRVIVKDGVPPVLNIEEKTETIEAGSTVQVAIAVGEDKVDKDAETVIKVMFGDGVYLTTDRLMANGMKFVAEQAGTYKVVYTSVDASSNKTEKILTYIVKAGNIPDESSQGPSSGGGESPSNVGCGGSLGSSAALWGCITALSAIAVFMMRKRLGINE